MCVILNICSIQMNEVSLDELSIICKDLDIHGIRQLGGTSRSLRSTCFALIEDRLRPYAEELLTASRQKGSAYAYSEDVYVTIEVSYDKGSDTYLIELTADPWDVIDTDPEFKEALDESMNRFVKKSIPRFWENFGFSYPYDALEREDWSYSVTLRGASSKVTIGIFEGEEEALERIVSLMIKLKFDETTEISS